jgi:hypothetical protein
VLVVNQLRLWMVIPISPVKQKMFLNETICVDK